jgi:hypothetical protein
MPPRAVPRRPTTESPSFSAAEISRAFLQESRRRLRREYLPKLRDAVSGMSATDLWWRPNPRSNSIGNLLLHLNGNVRQWILAGVARRADRRDRDAEFAARGGIAPRALLAQLERTLHEVDGVLAKVRPQELLEERTIQGYTITVLQAVYHVVEHFSGHTGQILWVTKQRRNRDLGFYPALAPHRGARPRRARLRRYM